MDDKIIPHLVARFLSWKLPPDFCPDAGISFAPEYNVTYNAERGLPPNRHEPTGTNLLNAEQAFAMFRHVLDHLAALNETHALVPREASDSMTEAAQDAADDHFSIDADKGPWLRQDGYKAAWAAMIKAALTAQEPRS